MQKNTSYKIKIEHPFSADSGENKGRTQSACHFYTRRTEGVGVSVSSRWKRERQWIIMLRFLVAPWIGKTIRLEGNYPEAFYAQMRQADDPATIGTAASADAFLRRSTAG